MHDANDENEALHEAMRIVAGEDNVRDTELEEAYATVLAYVLASATNGTYSRNDALEVLAKVHDDYGITHGERLRFAYSIALGALDTLAFTIAATRDADASVTPSTEED